MLLGAMADDWLLVMFSRYVGKRVFILQLKHIRSG
jgi:hypothetical protein